MRIQTLYEGHYRTLENRYAALVEKLIHDPGVLTVVAADAAQLKRLRRITLAVEGKQVIGGIRFFPGMDDLVAKLISIPMKRETVSHADRTLFALEAMETVQRGEPLYDLRGNPETAHSLAGFFEELLDQGVGSSVYMIQVESDAEESETVRVVGRMFQIYQEIRDRCYPAAGNSVAAMPIPGETSGNFVFYGFYDLNPGQRAVVRKLAACPDTCIHWFSPLGDLSPWSAVYRRTREFLCSLGISETVRCGGDSEMGAFASFFESLSSLTRPVPPVEGFRILVTSGPMGSARAVLSRVVGLRASGVPLPSVAVVCRSREESRMIARLAHHEQVPVASALEAEPGAMPLGRLLESLLETEAGQFHYTTLEKLAMCGCLRPEMSPEPGEVLKVVLSSGIRMGRERWRDWYATCEIGQERLQRLVSAVCLFYEDLPVTALPVEYAGRLEALVVSLVSETPGRALLDLLFRREMFRSSREVVWSEFAAALKINLRNLTVNLVDRTSDGFLLLTPEQVRGGLFRSVIITGMEDGIWPSVPREDPRLPDRFRRMLELPLKKDRELEDGFLLRQVAEAAEETFDLVYMQRNSSGEEVYPSPFIAPLLTGEDPSHRRRDWLTVESSFPMDVLLGGGSPGQVRARRASMGDFSGDRSFLGCVLQAEAERLGSGAFGLWDGMVGGTHFVGKKVTASLLERYVRCPFIFMAERIWGLRERCSGDVSAQPDPLTQGNVLHAALESLVMKYGFSVDRGQVREALEEASERENLEKILGSGELEDLFLASRVDMVKRSIEGLGGNGWKPLDKEVTFDGSMGDIAITGRLDLLLEDTAGDLVVLDLKTGKLPAARDTREGRVFQMPFYYSLVTANIYGKRVSGVYYAMVSEREPGKFEGFTGDEMQVMMPSVTARVEQLFSMIREGIYPPLPAKPNDCDRCYLRHLCRRTPKGRLHRKALTDPRLAVLFGEEAGE